MLLTLIIYVIVAFRYSVFWPIYTIHWFIRSIITAAKGL